MDDTSVSQSSPIMHDEPIAERVTIDIGVVDGMPIVVTAKLWETTRSAGVETTKLLKHLRRRFVRSLTADCFAEGISGRWLREYSAEHPDVDVD